ncbi:APH domain-containing protein [Favolaschia claudopus]|uniref:APH domain-containing protein n=1 Tax=Favolaschia claudopus TaxID=2862362 RepID=A0AAW0DJ87_9AGAR
MSIQDPQVKMSGQLHENDLSIPTGVQSYLSSTKFASHTVTPLIGGGGNWTFRLHLLEPFDGKKTLVAKHSRGYSAGDAPIALDIERQAFEAEALRRVKQNVLCRDGLATVPTVYHFDEKAHVIIMEDCGEGSQTLKALMREHPPTPAVAQDIGRALGEFLGRLHSWGANDSKLLDYFCQNELGKKITSWITYDRLIPILTSTPPHPAVSLLREPVPESDLDDIRAIINERTKEIHTSRETFTMGDFWTGNILVNLRVNPDGSRSFAGVYVVDWELAKAGVAALDVGQFCAEMLCLDIFHRESAGESSRKLIEAFLTEYRRIYAGLMKEHFANVAAKHVGAHLVTIAPEVNWGPPEESVKAVELGLEYLMEGCSDRWVRERSILAPLM